MSLVEQETVVSARQVAVTDNSDFANILDTAKFEQLQRIAKVFAACDLVPDHFKGKLPNCIIATQMALRLGVDPLAFMQNSYIVSGKCGVETKLATSLLNASGLIRGVIRYEITGSVQDKTLKCTAACVDRTTGEEVSHTLDWSDVVANEWNTKPAWKKDPRLMIQYRAAMRLIRLHYPGVILGLYAKEELEDMSTIDGDIVSSQRSVSEIESRLISSKPVGFKDNVGLPEEPADNGELTWQSEIAAAETIDEVEAARTRWYTILADKKAPEELDAMDLAANKRIAALER